MKQSIDQMDINDNWKAIYRAIQKALFNEEISIPTSFDWESVFEESNIQAISRIVHAGLKGYLPYISDNNWK